MKLIKLNRIKYKIKKLNKYKQILNFNITKESTTKNNLQTSSTSSKDKRN